LFPIHALNKRPHSESYRGRFAPSPSGLLHFGSLVAALASFLDAKHNDGKWLVRIEDIDPPREQIGASDKILKTLEAYHLHWDEDVLYQSKQSDLYTEVIQNLFANDLAYYCQCTRAQIKKLGGIYQGHCKNLDLPSNDSAIRLVNNTPVSEFFDKIQGHVKCDEALAREDFTIFRKDGLFAYQLAVTVDDIFQGITHVVRGCDLLEPTARQLSFFSALKVSAPQYSHIPLAITEQGYKLSKQNKAPAIDNKNPVPSIISALNFLGQQPPKALLESTCEEVIGWAIKYWSIDAVPKVKEITL